MLLLTFLTLSAFAQDDPVFEGTATADELAAEEPVGLLTAELGGNYTSGNSTFYTITGTLNGSYRWQRSKLGLIGGIIVGRGIVDADETGSISDAERNAGFVENARRYYADARYDYFVGEKDSLYFLAGAFVDPFAGYDLRSHEQLGYSRTLVAEEDTNLVAEIGIDLAQENYVDSPDIDPGYRDVLAARIMVGVTHNFSERVGFAETVEVYENLLDPVDVRVLNTASLSAGVSDKFAVKLSNTLIFDNQPVEGFRPLDQTTLVTLVASIL